MTQFLLLGDVFWPVDGGALPASHHGSLVDDLCTDAGDTSPAKERRVVGGVLESNMVEQLSLIHI